MTTVCPISDLSSFYAHKYSQCQSCHLWSHDDYRFASCACNAQFALSTINGKWQRQPKIVKTMQWHCLVWISLNT